MIKRTIITMAVVAATLLAAPRAAVAAGGMTVEEAAAVMREEGLPASVGSNGEAGDITSSAGNVPFYVVTQNCDAENRCTEFLFLTGIAVSGGLSSDRMNEWNQSMLAGRAYIDEENDPWLDHVVSVGGPDDDDAFRQGLLLWLSALYHFIDFLDEESGPQA